MPGLKSLDALIIAVCFRVAVPLWLGICKFFLWIRLVLIAAANRKRILVVARYGAIGDIIRTFPAVAELVRRNPGYPVVYVVRKHFKVLIEKSGLNVKVVATTNHLELPSKPSGIFKKTRYLTYGDEDASLNWPRRRIVDDFGLCLGFSSVEAKPTLVVDRTVVAALRADCLERIRPTERRISTLREPIKTGREGSSGLQQEDKAQRLLLLHSGPSWLVREWPQQSWDKLVQRLRTELGCAVLQLVAARNITVRDPVCHHIPGAETVTCEDDIERLINLVAAVDLLIGIDSGPIHVAGAVGTPCVALFGPTDPELVLFDPGTTGVFHRVDCSFCHHRHPRLHWQDGCPHGIKCMRELTVEQVFAAATTILKRPLNEGRCG